LGTRITVGKAHLSVPGVGSDDQERIASEWVYGGEGKEKEEDVFLGRRDKVPQSPRNWAFAFEGTGKSDVREKKIIT